MAKTTNRHFISWYSTYGLLTVQRVLAYLKIQWSHERVQKALNQKDHVLHKLLHVPMLNIFNGIIFQQAYDYQIYAQKLMIDYRLSPEFAKTDEFPEANIRSELSDQYDELMKLVKTLCDKQYEHYHLISESQAFLIECIEQLNRPSEDLEELNNNPHFLEQMQIYQRSAEEMTETFRTYRKEFYNIILSLSDRLASLSDYQFDTANALKEREALFFDREIGEKT